MSKVKEFKTDKGTWLREEDEEGRTVREFFIAKKKTKKQQEGAWSPSYSEEEEEIARKVLKELIEDDPSYIMKANATLKIKVVRPDGKPAAFASVDAMAVWKLLFWEFDRWIVGKTANFDGVVRLNVPEGKIHVRVRWRGKEENIWVHVSG